MTTEENSKNSSNDNETETLREKIEKKGQLLVMKLVRNPLLKYPRNSRCPCLSGKKFKRCCLPRLMPLVPPQVALQFKGAMQRPDLVFLTQENADKLREQAKEQGKELPLWGEKSDSG